MLGKLFKALFGSAEKVIGIEDSRLLLVDSCRSVVRLGIVNCDCKLVLFRNEASEVDLVWVVRKSARLPANVSGFWTDGDARIAGVFGCLA